MIVCTPTPVSTRVTAKAQYTGMSAASPSVAPAAAAPIAITESFGRSRRAASSAPITAPTARQESSNPYCPTPRPNSTVVIVAAKIGKFITKAPMRNAAANWTRRSGRVRT